MSFLSPWYALAGLAFVFPILFHLTRKRPNQEMPFSTLMFLDASPPRLTHRSKIDHWLLMLLRVAAIGLVAFAFTRPYWNVPGDVDSTRMGMVRMVLVDTSASMQRAGCWEQAREQVEKTIRDSSPTDVIAVYEFDSSLRPLLGLDAAIQIVPAMRQINATTALAKAKLTESHTDLASALIGAADLVQTALNPSDGSEIAQAEIVLVTDFQRGASIDALANIHWPTNCKVRIERVSPTVAGNAYATLLSNGDEEQSADPKSRIRVVNSHDSRKERFTAHWIDRNSKLIEDSKTDFSIPTGQTLSIAMPAQPANAYGIQLEAQDRSIRYRPTYFVPKVMLDSSVLCVEPAGRENEASLGYFLKRLPLSSPTRVVQFQSRAPGDATTWPTSIHTPLIVSSAILEAADIQALNQYVEQGGNLLWVWDRSAKECAYAEIAEQLTGQSLGLVSEATPKQFSLLSSIDYQHPLFADLADPKFSDFSKVRFWKHRRLDSVPEGGKVVAKFDDGSPAIVQIALGEGVLSIVTAGWQPEESQLALSTKFVPLISSFYRMAVPSEPGARGYRVGDTFELEAGSQLLDSDGNRVSSQTSTDTDGATSGLVAFERPGIFRYAKSDGAEAWVAVNLEEAEQDVAVGDISRLEMYGVQMGKVENAQHQEQRKRQLRANELESQQGWWRWLIVGVMGVVALESILCIRRPTSSV